LVGEEEAKETISIEDLETGEYVARLRVFPEEAISIEESSEVDVRAVGGFFRLLVEDLVENKDGVRILGWDGVGIELRGWTTVGGAFSSGTEGSGASRITAESK